MFAELVQVNEDWNVVEFTVEAEEQVFSETVFFGVVLVEIWLDKVGECFTFNQ